MRIDAYGFGEMCVEGKPYSSDLIIYPDRVESNWWRADGHRLAPGDLPGVLECAPEILVVGTGSAGGMEVPSATREFFTQRGIQLLAEPTPRAWRSFNALRQDHVVVGAFHLTC